MRLSFMPDVPEEDEDELVDNLLDTDEDEEEEFEDEDETEKKSDE